MMTGLQAWNPPSSDQTIQLGLSGDQTMTYCSKMRKITSTHYNLLNQYIFRRMLSCGVTWISFSVSVLPSNAIPR